MSMAMRRNLRSALFVSAFIVASPLPAQTVDTSEWICEYCPFESGHRGDYDVGATSVSDDSAYVGDATGYDEDGVYANLDGHGRYAGDGYRSRWTLADLGLDSRRAAFGLEKPGTFEIDVDYRELPRRVFSTTKSVFDSSGGVLTLPGGWVRAPLTTGFSALGPSLDRLGIESDRSNLGIGGRVFATKRWQFSADYRRHEQEGRKILGGSYYTNAALLPVEIDYVTDSVDLGVRYAGDTWTLALGWYLSDFENGRETFGWEHPFTTAAGAEFGALAQPPDSRFQQLSLSGSIRFPLYGTYLSFSAASGEIEQEDALPAYTTNAGLATSPLPRSNLGGDVETARYAIALTAKPLEKARVRLTYRYDERDNRTARADWNRVIADSFVSGEFETNIPYSFERMRFSAGADYDLFDTLRISAEYERRETDRDFQEVAEQTEDAGWGRLRWRPLSSLQIDVRGGTAKRDIERYDEAVAVAFGQNPLLRKYNLAYRFREFGELTVSYSPAERPFSLTFDALIADDSYTKSLLGITDGYERRYNLDVGWTVSDNASVYINAGLEDIESEQTGSMFLAGPDWRASHDDDFTMLGAGIRVRNIAERVDLEFDYTRSDGGSEIVVSRLGGSTSEFPELSSELDYVRLAVGYRYSERLSINLDLRYQRFLASDWALEGVGPAAIPQVLTLGAQPYSPEVVVAGVSFRYRFGTAKPAE